MPQNEAGRGALCFPGVYGNPLISLNVDFPPGVSPRFPGVREVIDFIENQNPHPGPHTPMHFAPSCERGASAQEGEASPLASVPGAVACRSCGRGIWRSPSWRGPQPPDLCAQCWRETDVERNAP